ncbi:MAG TPA: type II toxin-antitoxin system PemK/MazF family toxin [Candidatus Krumholzibacteria bacterium]|nr:type II toxin-antitoxin system PemK/MazF family toxin [Candidatus Krumholzibacteria bacterium]
MANDVRRGDIWWATLPAPHGSAPGYRRPVLIIQSNAFNDSRIGTVIVASITSNTELAHAPGNVRLDASLSRLSKDSVVNVSQLATLDRRVLTQAVSALPEETMSRVDEGLRLVLTL